MKTSLESIDAAYKILQESPTLPDKAAEPAINYLTVYVLVHVSNGQWLRICAFGLGKVAKSKID